VAGSLRDPALPAAMSGGEGEGETHSWCGTAVPSDVYAASVKAE
jgi:hypothetical protein